MLINSDFSVRAVMTPDQQQWVASPQAGVERIMLDRVGDEQARATSLVRYAPGTDFPAHQHPGGEEILVLSGIFSEDGRHYPAGWYVRNPPCSSHAPSSSEGAVIFVKLWQMPQSEVHPVRVNTRDASLWTQQGERESCPLFSSKHEQVSLQRIGPNMRVLEGPVAGAELLILEGSLIENGECFVSGTWMRMPSGRYPDLVTGDGGATMYLKLGSLHDQSPNAEVAC